MTTPRGDVVTQYDLESAEEAGLTKYDFLLTSAQDKIMMTLLLLIPYMTKLAMELLFPSNKAHLCVK